MSSAFIDPSATVRREFTVDGNPHWVEIKAELSFGEEQALAGALMGAMNTKQTDKSAKTGEVSLSMEFKKAAIEKIEIWVTEWSFTNAAGKTVAKTRESITNLRPTYAEAINDLIDAQIEANEAVGKPANGEASTP